MMSALKRSPYGVASYDATGVMQAYQLLCEPVWIKDQPFIRLGSLAYREDLLQAKKHKEELLCVEKGVVERFKGFTLWGKMPEAQKTMRQMYRDVGYMLLTDIFLADRLLHTGGYVTTLSQDPDLGGIVRVQDIRNHYPEIIMARFPGNPSTLTPRLV